VLVRSLFRRHLGPWHLYHSRTLVIEQVDPTVSDHGHWPVPILFFSTVALKLTPR